MMLYNFAQSSFTFLGRPVRFPCWWVMGLAQPAGLPVGIKLGLAIVLNKKISQGLGVIHILCHPNLTNFQEPPYPRHPFVTILIVF